MDSPREESSRVSLDGRDEWDKIKAILSDALKARLDQQIRSMKVGTERAALTKHLDEFLDNTFNLAQANLRINGRNFETFENAEDDGMEPFDEALDRRIWSLADNRMAWNKLVATSRRTVPQEVEKSLTELSKQMQEADQQSLAAQRKEEAELPEEPPEDDGVFSERYDQLSESYLKLSAITTELNQNVHKQYERSERFEEVAAEVLALKP